MQLHTAIKNANTIHARLKALGGLVATPTSSHEACQIRAVYIFGSTVKGSLAPNDLDVLVDFQPINPVRRCDKRRNKAKGALRTSPSSKQQNRKTMKWLRFEVPASEELFRMLKAGMKRVSLHDFLLDGNFEDIPATRVMLYPRNDFAAHMAQLHNKD